ncbi:MAG: serine/threonine-protein kinase, partial [Pirellula sp.]
MKEPSREIGRILIDLQILTEQEVERIRGLLDDRIRHLGGIDPSLEFTLQSVNVPEPTNLPKDWQDRIDIQTRTLANRGDSPKSKRGPWAPTTGLARYEIGNVIGIGGQGIVFEALDKELNRRVALKRVKPELMSDPEMAHRLIEEAQLASRFDHGGIAPVYDIGADDEGNPFFVMQLIRGEKLSDQTNSINYKSNSKDQFIAEIRPVVRRIIDVCNTLQYAYDKFGIIHQDLKPANIMVDRYGETIVMDWGMGRRVQLVENASIQLPISSTLDSDGNERGGSGTAGFLSPEQAQSINNLDHRTDVWGLGATLYKIVTGSTANRGANWLELIENAKKNIYLHPTEVNPLIPKELEAICLKAMAAAPENRYQNATDMASDLENWIAGDPVSALPEGRVKKAERFLRRHSRAAITSMLVMSLGLAGLLGAYLSVNTAWKQTLESRRLVSTVLEKIVGDTLDDGLSQVDDSSQVRVDLLSNVEREVSNAVEKHPDDLNLKLDYLYILIRLGNAQNLTSSPDAAATWKKADELVASVETRATVKQPDEAWARANADMRRYYVDFLLEKEEYENAQEQNEKARNLIDRLFQRYPSEPSLATSYALVHLQHIEIQRATYKNVDSKIESELDRIETALSPFFEKLKSSDHPLNEDPSSHGTILSYLSMLYAKATWYEDQGEIAKRDEIWRRLLDASKLASKIKNAGADGYKYEMNAYLMLHSVSLEKKDFNQAKSLFDDAMERKSIRVMDEDVATYLIYLCMNHAQSIADTDKDSCERAIKEATAILNNDELNFNEIQKLELGLCVVLAEIALAN